MQKKFHTCARYISVSTHSTENLKVPAERPLKMQSFDIWYISVGQILLKLHQSNWKKADKKMAIFYRTAFHSSKWLIFQYLSIQLLWCNFKSIWPTEMYYISKDCIFNGRSAGIFRFSVECILTEIYRAQVWKFFLHQTLSASNRSCRALYSTYQKKSIQGL